MTSYYDGLLTALLDVPDLEQIVVLLPREAVGVRIPDDPRVEVRRCAPRGGRIGRVAYEQLRLPQLARREHVDVLLSTHNIKPFGWRGASVVVLQSMQYFFLSDRIGRLRSAYLRFAVPRSLHGADVVIAVTEAQRADAIRLFGLEPQRVVAVRHGAAPWAPAAARAFADAPAPPPSWQRRPYVVTVSSLYELKNHRRLIAAFARVVREHRVDHELVIAGRDADVTRHQLATIAAEHGIADRVRLLGAVPQEELPALMGHADVVAYVSLYETFGHPVLEAFAFGRPLVTSDVGGTAELAGAAAVLVEPTSEESIAHGLGRILTEPALREKLAADGRRRLEDFSWESSAAGTAAALRQAIARHCDRPAGVGNIVRG